MATKALRLTATHPTGRVIEHIHPTLRDAQLFLGLSIYDNGYGDKRTAQTVCRIKPGESVTVAGATYSIDMVTA